MKRSLALFVATVFLLGVFAAPVNAADKVPLEDITNYSFDYNEDANAKLWTCIIINGVPHIGLAFYADFLCSEYKYDTKKEIFTFKYANHSGSLKVGSKTAYLNGKAIELPLAPTLYASTIYVSIPAVTMLFDRKATVVTKTSNYKYTISVVNGPIGNRTRDEKYIKPGDKLNFYNIAYNPGKTNYTDSQLTFMQGLAAPLFLHNIHQGLPNKRDDFSDKELSKHARLLQPVSGTFYEFQPFRTGFKDTIRITWGITTRKQLISSIESLLKSGNGTDKRFVAYDNSRAVQLSQIGYLLHWLTAEETITYGMKAAKQAQREFASWSDYADYYMQGARMVIPETGIQGAQARQKYVDFLYKGNAFRDVKWNISLDAPAKAK